MGIQKFKWTEETEWEPNNRQNNKKGNVWKVQRKSNKKDKRRVEMSLKLNDSNWKGRGESYKMIYWIRKCIRRSKAYRIEIKSLKGRTRYRRTGFVSWYETLISALTNHGRNGELKKTQVLLSWLSLIIGFGKVR